MGWWRLSCVTYHLIVYLGLYTKNGVRLKHMCLQKIRNCLKEVLYRNETWLELRLLGVEMRFQCYWPSQELHYRYPVIPCIHPMMIPFTFTFSLHCYVTFTWHFVYIYVYIGYITFRYVSLGGFCGYRFAKFVKKRGRFLVFCRCWKKWRWNTHVHYLLTKSRVTQFKISLLFSCQNRLVKGFSNMKIVKKILRTTHDLSLNFNNMFTLPLGSYHTHIISG